MGWDIALVETGNGGDITLNGNDLAVYFADENEIYMRMFGGNKEGNSKKNRRAGEEDRGYWANALLFDNDPAISFNSETERALNNTPLTSQGRVAIEAAIRKDLEGLDLEVTLQVVSDDRLRVFLAHRVTEVKKRFDLVRNPRNGDWDLTDFNLIDFF